MDARDQDGSRVKRKCPTVSGSFRKYWVPYFGVLIIRILLFRILYYIRVPYFRKPPYEATVFAKVIM